MEMEILMSPSTAQAMVGGMCWGKATWPMEYLEIFQYQEIMMGMEAGIRQYTGHPTAGGTCMALAMRHMASPGIIPCQPEILI